MKIAVVNTSVPFYKGGAELLADAVDYKLKAAGYKSDLIKIPFCWNPAERVLESYLTYRTLDFSAYDKIIAFKFPAYTIEHANKTIWLFHQFRQAYDLWGTPYQGIPNDRNGFVLRNAIIQADNNLIPKAKAIYCNSEITRDRLLKFNKISADILYPPLLNEEMFHCSSYENYIFCPSRINRAKRQYLLVESMRFVTSSVKLILAGLPETDAELFELNKIISKYSLHDKVTILNGFISEGRKIELMSKALGAVYIPYDEDSYGYVTLEALYSRKPVITCNDSGGILRLVKDQETGIVTEPEAQSIASAMDTLFLQKTQAINMGNNGFELLEKLDINWDNVLRRLIA